MKLYVGTYKKYNEGSLKGKWLDLDDYNDKDEFLEACQELHKDEKDPELMFQDMEYEYEWEKKLYAESCIPEEYWEIKNELARLDVDDEIFDAWLTNTCDNPTAEDVKTCREQYIGKYDSEADFAEQWYTDIGDPLMKSHLSRYINWDDVYQAEFSFDGFWNDNDYFFDSHR